MRRIKEAMPTRSGSNVSGNPVAGGSSPSRLLPVSAKIELALSREIDEHANAHGITRSRAAGQYLTIARETLRGPEGVAAGKAEENGAPIHFSPRAIERVKQRWEMEVLRGLQSQERRLLRRQPLRELIPLTPLRPRGFKARQAVLRFEQHRVRPRRLGPLTLAFLRSRPSRRAGQLAGRSVDAALGLLDRAMEIRDPERVARRISMRLLSKALPGPLRNALWLASGVASFSGRQR